MPLSITQTQESDTGWAAVQQANLAAIKAFVDDIETNTQNHPHQDVNNDQDVTFNDVAITNPADIFTATEQQHYKKDEIDDLIAGVLLNYWLSDTADGVIGDYNRIFDTNTGEAQSSIGPITIAADPTTIKAFVTAIDKPNLTILSAGVYALDIHAKTTVGANVKAAQLRWYLKKRTHPGGAETTLLTSEDSSVLTDAETHYTLCAALAEQLEIDETDRLVLLVVGIPTGAEPADPDVTIYMEGTCASRIAIRTTSAALDRRFLRLDGTKEMEADLDMGAHAIIDVGNVDGVDVSALKADVDEFPNELKNLTQAEIQQLENIGAITISAAQWGYLGAMTGRSGMTDRGDPTTNDFSTGDFTADGTWREWDFSSIVPAGARTVALAVKVRDDLVGSIMTMRELGNIRSYNSSQLITAVANAWQYRDAILHLNSDRKGEYWLTNTVWTNVAVTVKGWWFE